MSTRLLSISLLALPALAQAHGQGVHLHFDLVVAAYFVVGTATISLGISKIAGHTPIKKASR